MMKKAFLSCFIAVLFILALSGCQLSDTLNGDDSNFFELAENTTPCVATGARALASPGVPKAFATGGTTYSLFSVFQEYSYPEDEGIIDTGNIYKLVFEASNLFDGNKSLAGSIPLTSIASPFDFGTPAESYDHGYNEMDGIEERGNTYFKTLAYREDATTTRALLGYTVYEPVEDGTKVQRQIFQTTFDSLSKDIVLEYATFDDKPNSTTEDFGRRFYVEGNADSHDFFCHLATGLTSVSSIVGKGVSDGTGYYILCIPGTGGAEDRYFKLSAGATEADYEALDEEGSALGDLDDPEGYAAYIDDYLSSDAFVTRSTIPTQLGDFSNDGFVDLPE